jgi:uncharacterized Zn-binding protein involved in type VI secretion
MHGAGAAYRLAQTNSRLRQQSRLVLPSAGWFTMPNSRNALKRMCWGWLLSAAIGVIGLVAGLVALTGPGRAGPKDDMTGTVSKAEPPIKQDGTPAHPFADASQCPSSTDLIIWPRDRAIPRVPPGIAVCFVGTQSFKNNGPAVQVRQR